MQSLESSMRFVRPLKSQVMERSRSGKIEEFYTLCEEGKRVLDVGVSAEKRGGAPGRNYFLKTFRFSDVCYTGLGVQDLSGMEKLFPGKRFVQYPGGRFPFESKEFDWVFSNAVIEHVGDDAAQLEFVNEMLRVADNVYFTTPYKYFPVESHTNLVFLHWNDRLFYHIRKRRKPRTERYQIYLFSIDRLTSVMEKSNAAWYKIRKNRLAGMVMTLSVVCSEQPVSDKEGI